MQHFDQRPYLGSTYPYLIVSLRGGYYVMCGAMVGCVVCEGYAFFIKKMHVYLIDMQNMRLCKFCHFKKVMLLIMVLDTNCRH